MDDCLKTTHSFPHSDQTLALMTSYRPQFNRKTITVTSLRGNFVKSAINDYQLVMIPQVLFRDCEFNTPFRNNKFIVSRSIMFYNRQQINKQLRLDDVNFMITSSFDKKMNILPRLLSPRPLTQIICSLLNFLSFSGNKTLRTSRVKSASLTRRIR
jgi:hypothetical protein